MVDANEIEREEAKALEEAVTTLSELPTDDKELSEFQEEHKSESIV